MVARACLAALLLSLASCDLVYMSAYPERLLFEEKAVSVSDELGGSRIVSSRLSYAPNSGVLSTDLLVAVVSTDDGKTRVLLYSAPGLKLLKVFQDDELRATNSGNLPLLEWTNTDLNGLHLGSLHIQPDWTLLPNFELPVYFQNYEHPVEAYRWQVVSTPSPSYTLWIEADPLPGYHYYQAADYESVTDPFPQVSVPLVTSTAVSAIAATYYEGLYYLVLTDGYVPVLLSGPDPANLTAGVRAAATMSGMGGWASATAAVFETYDDGGKVYSAWSWDGRDLGMLNVTQDEAGAAAFAPSGKLWYQLDSRLERLSAQRTWW